MAGTTWSTTDKTASVTLSNGNLTATTITVAQGLRAADRQASGKFYLEFTMNTTNSATYIGLVGINTTLGISTTVAPSAVVNINGTISVDNVSTGIQLGVRSSGDVYGVAVDLSNRLIWFRVAPSGNWNNSAAASPGTGVGGIGITGGLGLPLYPWAYFNGAGNIVANFGDSAFSGTVPSGFTSGFTAGATINTNALVTQAAVEEWYLPVPQMWLTQAAVEQWQVLFPDAQVTQIAIEEWGAGSPAAQVTQIALEEWGGTDASPLWVTQVAFEHWATTTSGFVQIAVTQAALEHWAGVAPPPVWVTQAAIEHWAAAGVATIPSIGPMITTIF
jgi:hypothetical protein